MIGFRVRFRVRVSVTVSSGELDAFLISRHMAVHTAGRAMITLYALCTQLAVCITSVKIFTLWRGHNRQ